jgi:hypothetical protein
MISTLGPSMKTVFRSRWRALWWSAGVLLTAYCSVPSQDDEAAKPTPVTQPSDDAGPWAKDVPAK